MYFVNGVGWTSNPSLYYDEDDFPDNEKYRSLNYDCEEYFDREAMEYCGLYEDDDEEDYEYALSLIKELFESE